MSFQQLFLLLRARFKIVVTTLLVTVLLTIVISLLISKSYKATATVIVNYKGADPVTGMVLPAQLMPGYMATQVSIISSKNVAYKVISGLKLAESPTVKQDFVDDTDGEGTIEDWLSELLLKKLDVTPSRESSIIEISFYGANPQFSAAIANAFAEAYLQTNIQLKVEPSKKAAIYFTDQLKDLKNDLENAQQKLSAYQQEKGIVSVDERLDVERARLNDLSTQLVMAQGQAMEAQSRQRNSNGTSANESPDIASNPVIQSLKADIARAESKFANISQTVERNHPQYQSAKAEVDHLRDELNRQVQQTSGTVATNARILQQRESEIRAALEAQKIKVLELNRDRDALSILVREVESAQNAYDLATQRFSQTNIEGQSNQSDVAILNPATVPLKPASPRILLNTAAAIFLGTLLGLGLAIVAELLDKRIRSPEDLVEILQAPVLGVMVNDKKITRNWLSWIFRKKPVNVKKMSML
ncbi:chain length determinant protein EpsF [Methylovorus sp. MM2]|uniref:chain length determinant protein EpsF n=1 Tax=Methylovorus sp. MM2 TaxID=1848038 RepID=UPI0007DF64C7|nr:chain length determinant protein EpsF [Methylovorus sp. MM2]OAM51204.1 chain length determinant protein EpsF [Methylovorus sp. MM2]